MSDKVDGRWVWFEATPTSVEENAAIVVGLQGMAATEDESAAALFIVAA